MVLFMLDVLSEPSWSPYLAGAGIGVLVCMALLLSDRPLGCSTAYAKASGLISRALSRQAVDKSPYYRLIPPAFDWPFMVIPGILIGSFASAVLSGTFRPAWVPYLFASAFGGSVLVRMPVAVAGGILLAIGARWAGGCTSGHGISGSIQLALSGFVAAACFFVGGIVTAFVLFGLAGG